MTAFLLSIACALVPLLQDARGGSDEADRAYAYVAGLAEKGLDEMVVKEAQVFLDAYPRSAKRTHARYRLGVALLDLGRTREAERTLAGKAGPAEDRGFEFAAEANARLARCRLILGDASGAQACATRALEWGQAYIAPLALVLRADASSALSDWNGARSDYEAALSKEPRGDHAVDARIGLAWCALRAKDAAEGKRRARELLSDGKLPPAREGEVRCLLGECALDGGDVQEALASFRSVRDPALFDAAARGAGFALAAAGDHKGAAAEFARVVSEHPQSTLAPECALRCGIELLAAGDAAGAREALSSKLIVGDGQSLFWRARAELESGDAAAALATLDRARKMDALDTEWTARIETARGAALSKLGRHDEAARAYKSSGSIDGLQAAAATSLAAGHFDEAAATARTAVALDGPPDKLALAWLTLGEARLGAQDYSEGEKAFLSAAKLDPDASRASRAKLRAGWCRFLAGDARGARTLFEDASRGPLSEDEKEEASFLCARAAESSGDRPAAQKLFADQVTAHPRGVHAVEACVRLARLSPDEPAIALLAGVARATDEGEWAQEARFDLAERLSAQQRFDDAAARYGEVVASKAPAPLVARARYGLAWCAFSKQKWNEAAQDLDALLQQRELDPGVRVAAAELAVWTAVRTEDPDRAIAAWKSARAGQLDPRKQVALAREVCDLLRAKDRSRDVATILADLEASGDADARWFASTLRTRAAIDGGDLDGAARQLDALERAASSDPLVQSSVLDARFALAEARFAAGDAAHAIPLYDSIGAVDASALADRALYKAGFARLGTNDPAGAERSFARLIEAHPKSVLLEETLFLRAEALFRLDRLDESIALLERVRKEAPDHAVTPKVLFRLGTACARKERWTDAVAALDLLARKYPKFENLTEADLWRGRALAGNSDPRGARTAFERAVARSTSSGDSSSGDRARIELGRLLVAGNDLDGALSAFLKVAVLSGDSEAVPEALYCAGETLERQGDVAHACDRFREVVKTHTQSTWAARAQSKLDQLAPKVPTQRAEQPAQPAKIPSQKKRQA